MKMLLESRYIYIFGTICFTIYGQLILKWRITKLSISLLDISFVTKVTKLIALLFDPFILSGFISAFIASLFWMGAMSKFQLTEAYPFMSLSPAIVFILGIWLLNESFSWGKVVGLVFIIIGIIITVKF